MHLSSVLLPEPFSPMRPNVEPSGTSNETSCERPELLVFARRPPHARRLQRLVPLVVEADSFFETSVDGDRGARLTLPPRGRRSSFPNTHSPKQQQPTAHAIEVERWSPSGGNRRSYSTSRNDSTKRDERVQLVDRAHRDRRPPRTSPCFGTTVIGYTIGAE